MKTSVPPITRPSLVSGKMTFPEDLKPIGAEHPRGGDRVLRHVFERADQSQDHQRQEELQESDKDRRLVTGSAPVRPSGPTLVSA